MSSKTRRKDPGMSKKKAVEKRRKEKDPGCLRKLVVGPGHVQKKGSRKKKRKQKKELKN